MKIICWWSGGVTSAVSCKLALDKFGRHNCDVIMIDTKNEHDDTYRFLDDCEKWYSKEIKKISNNSYKNIQETWYRHLSLNTANGAICSYKLKRVARENYEKTVSFNHQVFGFEYTKKEINRAKSLKLNHPNTRPIFPLIETKMNKLDCIKFVQASEIEVPESYKMGFKNNNCLKTGCVQGGIGYWQKIKRDLPDLFEKMANIEHDLTNKKGKPVTMLKDQSKNAEQRLVFLKPHPAYPSHKSIEDMRGVAVKPLFECNGFCGTNDLDVSETERELNYET